MERVIDAKTTVIWQKEPEDRVAEPALLVKGYLDVIAIQQGSDTININREALPEIIRVLWRTLKWATKVWNPVTGCTKVSQGCKNCYAERMATRLAGRVGYPADEPFRVTLHPERLDMPRHWRKPARVFVNSMSDLFHSDVPDEFIARVFGTMSGCKKHTFMVLTKRPERMLKWLMRCGNGGGLGWITHNGAKPIAYGGDGIVVGENDRWPLPNVWLGVSVEDQTTADERIPLLLQTPAAVHFVSCEPLLGPVDLNKAHGFQRPIYGDTGGYPPPERLDWVICGGESGPGARPMHPDWARSLRDQCADAGVPYFFKQWEELWRKENT